MIIATTLKMWNHFTRGRWQPIDIANQIHIEPRRAGLDCKGIHRLQLNCGCIPIPIIFFKANTITQPPEIDLKGAINDDIFGAYPIRIAKAFDTGSIHWNRHIKLHQIEEVRRWTFKFNLQSIGLKYPDTDLVEVE